MIEWILLDITQKKSGMNGIYIHLSWSCFWMEKMRIFGYQVALELTLGARWNGVFWHICLIMPFIRFCKRVREILSWDEWDPHSSFVILFLDGDFWMEIMRICGYQVALELTLGAWWNGALAERIIERLGTTARVSDRVLKTFFSILFKKIICWQKVKF